MSEKIYRYMINKVDGGVQILRETIYPVEFMHEQPEVIETLKVSVQDSLHIVAGMNSKELTRVSSKVGNVKTVNEPKNKYIVGEKEWNVPQLLDDVRDNNFMLRIDNHTVAYSNFDNKRRVSVTSLVHYQTELLTITSTEQGVETIDILIPERPAQAMVRRVNSVLGFYGWRIDRYEQNPDFELCVRRIGEHVVGGYIEGTSLDVTTDVMFIPHD